MKKFIFPLLAVVLILAIVAFAFWTLTRGEGPSQLDQGPGAAASDPTPTSARSDRNSVSDGNATWFNEEGDLWALNRGDFIALWWSPEKEAKEYSLYRGLSETGDWEKVATVPLSTGVDFTTAARVRELCYRVEGVDDQGTTVRTYSPVCVPEFQEEGASGDN